MLKSSNLWSMKKIWLTKNDGMTWAHSCVKCIVPVDADGGRRREKFPVRIVKCEWEERRGWKWGLVRTRLRPCGLLDFSDGCFYFKSEKWKILSVDVFFRKLLFSFFVLVILLRLLTIFFFFFFFRKMVEFHSKRTELRNDKVKE